jgi:act minimal PKS acyl carrier protein
VPQMTLSELRDIMDECAGADESAQSLEDAPDVPFADLGYDSISLLETQGRIERDYGVKISEDDIAEIITPREFVEFCNSLLPKEQAT